MSLRARHGLWALRAQPRIWSHRFSQEWLALTSLGGTWSCCQGPCRLGGPEGRLGVWTLLAGSLPCELGRVWLEGRGVWPGQGDSCIY